MTKAICYSIFVAVWLVVGSVIACHLAETVDILRERMSCGF